jgi:hypothetical protein
MLQRQSSWAYYLGVLEGGGIYRVVYCDSTSYLPNYKGFSSSNDGDRVTMFAEDLPTFAV